MNKRRAALLRRQIGLLRKAGREDYATDNKMIRDVMREGYLPGSITRFGKDIFETS